MILSKAFSRFARQIRRCILAHKGLVKIQTKKFVRTSQNLGRQTLGNTFVSSNKLQVTCTCMCSASQKGALHLSLALAACFFFFVFSLSLSLFQSLCIAFPLFVFVYIYMYIFMLGQGLPQGLFWRTTYFT